MNTPQLVGESCFVESNDPSLFLPDRLWQIRVDPSRVDARWLSYIAQSPRVATMIKALATGTSGSMKNIAKSSLLKLQIPLPPLEEQRRIAEILRTLDDQVIVTSSLVEKLKNLHQALLHKCFAEAAGKTAYLGDMVSKDRPIVYGILMPGDHFPNGVPVVKVKDMKSGKIKREDLLLTNPAIDREYQRSRLREGDILLSIRGTVGRVCVVPSDLDGANITQDSARICVPGQIGRHIAHYLTSSTAQRFIDSEAVGLAVRGINLRDVRRIEVPIVSEDRAAAIANILDASQATVDCETRRLSKLSNLKLGLVTDLLSGRVRVPSESLS